MISTSGSLIFALVLVTSQLVFAELNRDPVLAKLQDICNDNRDVVIESTEEIHFMAENFVLESCGRSNLEEQLSSLSKLTKQVDCGRVKIHELSQFHWNYVIGSVDSKWRKAHPVTLPDALLRYFIDFATKLGQECANQLDENLNKMKQPQDDQLSSGASLQAAGLDHALHMLVDKKDISTYNDFLLLWQAFANKYKRRGYLENDEVNDMKDNFFSHVVLSDTNKVQMIQQECAESLRPIYQETTLPVMNLIDLGYGKDWSSNKVSDLVKEWYRVTQYCELALGVQFYRDPNLGSPKIIDGYLYDNKAPRVEFKSRASIESQSPAQFELSDEFIDTNEMDTKTKADEVRSNIKSRAAIRRKIVGNLIRFAGRHPLSSIKNMASRAKQNTKPELKSAFLLHYFDPKPAENLIETKSLQVGVGNGLVTILKLVPQLIAFIIIILINGEFM